MNLFTLPWPKDATYYSEASGSYYKECRDEEVHHWNEASKMWVVTSLTYESLKQLKERPTRAQYYAFYKDALIRKIGVAVNTGSGPTAFPFGPKGLVDRFNMVREAMAEFEEQERVLTGMPKFYAGQKVHIKPSEKMKRGRTGWVDGVSEIGGYCAATARKVENGERLYYVRLKEAYKVRPFLYTFSEEVLQAILEPLPKPPKITPVNENAT